MSAIDESSVDDQELVNENFTIPQSGHEDQVWSDATFEMSNNLGSAFASLDLPLSSPLDTTLDPLYFGNNINTYGSAMSQPSSQYLASSSLPDFFTDEIEDLGIDGQLGQHDLQSVSNVMSNYSSLFDLTTSGLFDNVPEISDDVQFQPR